MKRFLCIVFLLTSTVISVQAQDGDLTTFILIRHAEKGDNDPRNPDLSAIGKERAQSLSELLKHTSVDAIYSTPYKRTQQTVMPLSEAKGVEVQDYDPRSMDFLKSIMSTMKGKTIVVSGHSNTTPFVANALIGEQKFAQLSEKEYDKVFVVTISELGKGTVQVLSY